MQTQIVVLLFSDVLSNWCHLHEHLETSPCAFQDTFHIPLFCFYLTAPFAGYAPSLWTLIGWWQGFIFGPLLFNIHFLDILQSHDFKYPLHINDSQIYISSSDPASKLQSHISNFLLNISNWMSNRLLKLKMSQIALLFPFKLALPLAFPVITDSPMILPVAQVPLLSLILDSSFSHILPFNSWPSPIGFTFKMYPASSPHFHCCHSDPNHHHLSPGLLQELPNKMAFFHHCPFPHSAFLTLLSQWSCKNANQVVSLLC